MDKAKRLRAAEAALFQPLSNTFREVGLIALGDVLRADGKVAAHDMSKDLIVQFDELIAMDLRRKMIAIGLDPQDDSFKGKLEAAKTALLYHIGTTMMLGSFMFITNSISDQELQMVQQLANLERELRDKANEN